MSELGSAFVALVHNGNLYSKATDLLNSSIGEPGFHIWVDLPDGSQLVIPKGSTLHTLSYDPISKDTKT